MYEITFGLLNFINRNMYYLKLLHKYLQSTSKLKRTLQENRIFTSYSMGRIKLFTKYFKQVFQLHIFYRNDKPFLIAK